MIALPVVRDTDHGLLTFIAHKFDLILDVQNRLAIFLAGSIPNLALHGARVSFFSIITQIRELYPLFPISIYWYRTVEVFLAPALGATVQTVGPVVGM